MVSKGSAILCILAMALPVPNLIAQNKVPNANPDEVIVSSDSALVYSYLDEATNANKEGDVRRQRKLLGRAHKVADSVATPSLVKAVEKDLGDYYLSTGSVDSAEVVLEGAVDRPTQDDRLQVQILNLLGTTYTYQSNYSEAMATYNRGLALMDSLKHPDIQAAMNANKANIYKELGNYSEAISLYSQGISFAEAEEDSSFLVTALNNLGDTYNQQENYEEAKSYLEEGITIATEQGFLNSLVRLHHNMAISELELSNFEAAREHYRKAWDLHEQVRPNNVPVQLLNSMGQLHLTVGELEEAKAHFRESLDESRKVGIPPGIFHNLLGLGDVAKERGNFEEASQFYEQALKLADKVKSPPFRISASERLYQMHKASGNFEQALTHHETAKYVSDSLFEVQQKEQLALAETELGLRQQQKINQLLQERQQQQEVRIQTQNWLIIASVIVIIGILIFLYALYHSNKERKRVNSELEELNDVKNKMMTVIAHDLRSPMASMQGILYLLKNEDMPMDEVRKMASELEVSIQQNIDMMDNLLNWTQSQMKGLETDIKVISAYDITDNVLDNCQFQADHKSIKLENKVPENIDVKADPNLMKLIVRNLVNNAIKFSNEGDTVTVDAAVQNGNVVLKVKDTGIGIPQKEQEHIFSVSGNSRSGTQNEKGSGLGLKLCKEFTEKQNGGIYLESTEGEGTTFYINLPKGDN